MLTNDESKTHPLHNYIHQKLLCQVLKAFIQRPKIILLNSASTFFRLFKQDQHICTQIISKILRTISFKSVFVSTCQVD